MPPGLAALVLQAQVIFTIADRGRRAARAADAPPRWRASLVGSVGLAVVAVGRGGHVTVVALALCLLGALSWGIGNVVSRASGVKGGLSLTVWSAVVVPVPLLALSLVVDGPAAVGDALASFSWQAAVSTLYTAGLASLVGYGVFNTLLVAQPVVVGRAVGAARPGGGDGVGVAAARPAAERRRAGRRRAADRRRAGRAAARRGQDERDAADLVDRARSGGPAVAAPPGSS